MLKFAMKNSKYNRFTNMLIGNIIIGFGISIGVYANLGIDPGMTFFYGITKLTGLSLGMTTAICNILFIVPLLLYDRKRIGIATIFNMLCMGYIVDFFALNVYQGNVLDAGALNYIVMMIGIILQSFGVALYSSADMGQSPLDGIPNIVVMKTGKFSYRSIRVLQDSTLVLIGFLCNIKIGVGTLMLMFFVGPLIHFFQEGLKRFQGSHLESSIKSEVIE